VRSAPSATAFPFDVTASSVLPSNRIVAGGAEILGARMNGESGPIGTTKQLLSEEVFLHLGMAIVRGELAPHDRIRDADIARELHVSRMPIREALQRLERIGLVTMYPSRYTEVTAVSDGLVADSAEFAGYQAGIAARLAAERMTDS
jgi:DNA-binding GntR family transcriptional regulator